MGTIQTQTRKKCSQIDACFSSVENYEESDVFGTFFSPDISLVLGSLCSGMLIMNGF